MNIFITEFLRKIITFFLMGYYIFSDGVLYDNIDLNKLLKPEKYYSAINGIYLDIRYFSTFYLYAKLFETSFYSKYFAYVDNINYYIFNSSKQIKNICSGFDFNSYINTLDENNIVILIALMKKIYYIIQKKISNLFFQKD